MSEPAEKSPSHPEAIHSDIVHSEWSLQEEILVSIQQWYLLVTFCLIGALAAWVGSFIWPSTYQATIDLHVGLSISQAPQDRNVAETAGIQFTNIDDYKNWQMANLNSLIYMDEIVGETLSRLQKQDISWSEIDQQELSAMLHAYWRNAGKWQLVAEDNNQLLASQAVTTWHKVIIERVSSAVSEAQNSILLDNESKALAETQIQLKAIQDELSIISDTLKYRREALVQHPDDQPLTEIDRWLLLFPLTSANLEPIQAVLLDNFPSEDAPYKDYHAWLNQVSTALEQKDLLIQKQIERSQVEQERLANRFLSAAQESLGVSAKLQVATVTNRMPLVKVIRPIGLMMLIGSCLGLIVWVLVQTIRISLHAKQ